MVIQSKKLERNKHYDAFLWNEGKRYHKSITAVTDKQAKTLARMWWLECINNPRNKDNVIEDVQLHRSKIYWIYDSEQKRWKGPWKAV